MARVKRAVHSKKHRRAVLEQAQGYFGNKSRSYRAAHEQVMHSLQYAYRDRRARKGDFRQLWIQRINAGARGARHELQPADRRAASRRRRGRPQDPGRPRRARRRRLRRPVEVARDALADPAASAAAESATGLTVPGLTATPPPLTALAFRNDAVQRLRRLSERRRARQDGGPLRGGRRQAARGGGQGGRGDRGRVRRPRGRRAGGAGAGRDLRAAPAPGCGRCSPASSRRVCDTVTPQPLAAIVRAVDVPLDELSPARAGPGRGLRPGRATPATSGPSSAAPAPPAPRP